MILAPGYFTSSDLTFLICKMGSAMCIPSRSVIPDSATPWTDQLHPGLRSGHLGHIPCLPEVMKTERANIWPRRPLRHWHLETRHSRGRRVCWMPRATSHLQCGSSQLVLPHQAQRRGGGGGWRPAAGMAEPAGLGWTGCCLAPKFLL